MVSKSRFRLGWLLVIVLTSLGSDLFHYLLDLFWDRVIFLVKKKKSCSRLNINSQAQCRSLGDPKYARSNLAPFPQPCSPGQVMPRAVGHLIPWNPFLLEGTSLSLSRAFLPLTGSQAEPCPPWCPASALRSLGLRPVDCSGDVKDPGKDDTLSSILYYQVLSWEAILMLRGREITKWLKVSEFIDRFAKGHP